MAEHIPRGFCVLEDMGMRKGLELLGKRFGRLTVIARAGRDKHGHSLWWCLCKCREYVIISGSNLNNKSTKSCGCLNRDVLRKRNLTHGKRYTSEYNAWANIKARCFNSKNTRFKNYGGRGITVCKRWDNFENFIADMGKKPSSKHTIERVDNNGNYEPGNCVWATYTINNRNKRKRKNNKTGYNGVSQNKRTKKYVAQIDKIHLGCFGKLQDAVTARRNGELKYWGKNYCAGFEIAQDL